jgi:PKD repeat protein
LRLGSLATGITLQANGGSGGNTDNSNQNRCFGPGGGGGGGNIRTNLTGISTPSGGAPGEVTNATGACNASSNDAAYGAQGVVGPWTDMPQAESGDWTSITTTDPTDVTVCRGKQAVFAVVANAGNWEYRWQYNTGAGWTDVPASPPYQGGQSPVLTIAYTQDVENGTRFRCQVSLPGCSPAVSNAATLTLVSTPIPGFSISQQGNTLQLLNTATGATAYYWTFGDGTTATTPTPTHTYLAEGSYTITQYAINACDTAVATQTITILAPPQAGFSVPASTTDCNAVTLMPKNMASTNATSIEWKFPGGQPPTYTGPNPSVTYLQTGTYTITQIVRNTAGADTLSKTVYVQADPIPFAAFNIISIVNGELKVQNLSAPGAVYVWNFGDGTPLVTAFEPSHVYTQSGTYVITLNVVNLCGASILQNQIQIVLLSATDQGDLRLGVFPNPTPGIVQVVAAEAPDHLRLLDMNGRLYQEIISCSTQNTLDLSTLPDGFYVIQYIRGRQVRNIRIGKVSE